MEFREGELLILGGDNAHPMFARYVKAFRSDDGEIRHRVRIEGGPDFPHFVETESLTRIGERRFFACGQKVWVLSAPDRAPWPLCEVASPNAGEGSPRAGAPTLAQILADALEEGGYSLGDLQ